MVVIQEERIKPPKKTPSHPFDAILIVIIGFCILLVGGLLSNYKPGIPPPGGPPGGGLCCDSGDGPNCHPLTGPGQVFTFKNVYTGVPTQYGLLKSNITMNDCGKHVRDSGQKAPNGDPIIIDTSNEVSAGLGECGDRQHDTLADFRHGKACYPIPDDELIYVCRKNCSVSFNKCDPNAKDFYGDGTTVYDVYFRLSDYPTPGVPELISTCQGAWNPDDNKQNVCNPSSSQPTILTPYLYPSHPSLQLHWFLFNATSSACPQQWIRPFCKPAVYVYPEQKEPVTVKVFPKGNMTFTYPSYPSDGWHIVANPNGNIELDNKIFDYLYYEAQIPDTLVSSKTTGYVIAYNNLADLFNELLPKLGLNTKEKNQFAEYWLKALPKVPYYFVSVVPQTELDSIAPLAIEPQPETILRVALNFQPLDKPISVVPPQLPTVTRKGFTVVEWSGLYKQDKKHPFTCLM